MNITKQQVTVYKMRGLEHGNWADFTIDEGEKAGRISISSDWGNWANYWGACGESFKKFLCSLDIYYFAGKVGESNWLDTEKTVKCWKKTILERRRENSIDENLARFAFDELKDADENYSGSDFIYAVYNCDNLLKALEYDKNTQTDVSPSFRNFWEKAWLPFIAYLKKEPNQ